MFECLEVAHEAVGSIRGIVATIARRDRSMAEQMRRAAVSIVSNIDEAAGVGGARRTDHFRIALGSTRELTSQLRVAHAWGLVENVSTPLDLLDRVRAMLWRLTH
jgi:four helix bundle protein